MFAKIVDGIPVQFPYTDSDIRRDNPGTSFPLVLADEIRAELGVLPVTVTGQPEFNAATQAVGAAGCVYNDQLGRWETAWVVRDLTQEEIAARVPRVVTMRQGRRALLDFGLLDTVDAALAAISDPIERRKAQIDWEYAAEINRDDSLVASLSSALGLTGEQLDQLFMLASTK